MIRLSLDGLWLMKNDKGVSVQGSVPGSVYSFLLDAGLMEDPYYRDRELDALKRMEEDYTFSRSFLADTALTGCVHQILRFEGIDTLADVYLNGVLLGRTDNMHITWEFDVKGILKEGENELVVEIDSPVRYIRQEDEKYHLGGSTECMRGFPHLRKAHCMFGWDWGPRLPDAGIWRSVVLEGWNESRIEEIRIRQVHKAAGTYDVPERGTESATEGVPGGAASSPAARKEAQTCVELTVEVLQSGEVPVVITLTGPDGTMVKLKNGKPYLIRQPKLWWPNGLGEQPLYEVKAVLQEDSGEGSSVLRRIGLRTVNMKREKDQWGETFAMEVNGRSVFSMGADYIPEDNILSRMNRERTRALLEICRQSHFNVIRVWGGGIYPADWFYDLCDEMGLVVWQDMMFACANYRITDDFVASITAEITQNVRRIRHHASLGLWCGNNEMEQFALERGFDGDDITAADYLIQNEYITRRIVEAEDPDTFYWPSSPSSGGKYDLPQDPDRGDVHFWAVWHAGVPFTAYRDYYFRYMSEFGFQSFPCMETIRSFTEEEDRNIFSYVMEMHQRNSGANGKILQYLSATYLYPTDFDLLVYASQLLQADAIRYGVEHLRRNRDDDRCMGAVYWQLNDIWPVASWASVDWYLRWKALQYAAKRFFAPVLLSCREDSEVSRGRTCISEPAPAVSKARLNVSNETWDTVSDEVVWELREADSSILESGSFTVYVLPFSTQWCDELDFSSYDPRSIHLNYYMKNHGSAGSVLFTAPKHYRFEDPQLSVSAGPGEGEITVTAGAYARSVEIFSGRGYIRTEDNFFDMEKGSRTVRLLEGSAEDLQVRSVYSIR